MRLVLMLRKHNRSQAMLARSPNGLAMPYAGVLSEPSSTLLPHDSDCVKCLEFTCTIPLHMHGVRGDSRQHEALQKPFIKTLIADCVLCPGPQRQPRT
jgi:hypothetical protein